MFIGDLLPDQLDLIRSLRDALVSSEPIRAELDRGVRVLMPAQAKERWIKKVETDFKESIWAQNIEVHDEFEQVFRIGAQILLSIS